MDSYQVLGVIGQGQYGTAYKAQHRLDGQLYCIKRIGMANKEDQNGALREVQLLAQLDHPNIISYKESFVDPQDGALCIVTSFCEDGDLFTRIRKRQQSNHLFSEEEVMDMFVQIASAIMHIHSKRILHRDLKTQNIFITRGNIIKLGDFGISKVLEKTDHFATTVTGTPYYMAPEICTNQPYTFKSDIWSLGCVLYELCTLKHAFAADSLLSLVYQIVRGTFPPISTTHFSKGLSELVNALLVRDTATRPSLAQVFQMPFVVTNLQRYNAVSEQTLTKHSATMARKRQAADRALAAGKPGDDAGDATLTPKERLARSKEAERQRRQLELQAATLNGQKDREIAAARKAANIQGSRPHGLPGSNSPLPPAAQPAKESSSYLDDTSSPNLGTVNIMPTIPFGTGTGSRPASQPAIDATKAAAPSRGSYSAYEALENRPIHSRGGGAQRPGSGFLPAYDDDDDNVLIGTVAGTRASQQHTGGYSRLQQPPGATNMQWPGVHGGSNAGPPPVVPSNIVGGFKFGLTNSGDMPALPLFPPSPTRGSNPSPPSSRPTSPPSAKIKFGISSNSQPRGSFEFVVKTANSTSSYEDDVGAGAVDGRASSTYESDFEDYTPTDDQDTINTRCKILNNLQDLERTGGRDSEVPQHLVREEMISATTRNGKAVLMRERCQDALGFYFPQVYAYLRRVRTSESGSTEEAVVRRELLDLVGGNKGLLQGCFLVDQLVFQEMMFT